MKIKPIEWRMNKFRSICNGSLGMFEFEISRQDSKSFELYESNVLFIHMTSGTLKHCREHAQSFIDELVKSMTEEE